MKILGTTNDVTTCECCGRSNLKKTVVLSNGEGEVYYGTECAALAMGSDKKTVEKGAREADKSREAAAEAARVASHDAEEREYSEWLQVTYGDRRSDMVRRKAWRAAMMAS